MIASLPLPSIYLPTEGNGPYPYDRRMVLQLQAHELALIDRLRARGTKTPKHRPKQTEAPLLGKCSWSAFDVVNSVLAVRSACLKRIQFLKSGPIVEVNVYPDVEPLVYRLRPLAWRFALSFQSYGFLSPSSCWTDPLYLSFLSECFSKPSFFQNLLRSSFFLRTQGKEDEPYYCKTQKIEQKKYSLTEGAKRKRGLALASLGVFYFLVAQQMYSLPAYAFIAQDFTTQAALYTNLFIRCLRNRPQPLKYVVRGVAYSIQAISLRGLWNERKAGTKRDFNGDFPVVLAMRLVYCLTRKRERSSGLN
ncbi:hypothetical protein L1987_45921 [Smallanthus sonchifolius]|uniref:Uncharacterized protein n=1 Tax=Smallanthus sonchifolius TaxID=185202 RepID=A0ACB9FY68_9ASTR|nr:hypothetical protein L1987_45921 [Smallanthus sonchifolius]